MTYPCTCHPDDNPPEPCQHKYAYSECVEAARSGADRPDRLRAWAANCLSADGAVLLREAADEIEHLRGASLGKVSEIKQALEYCRATGID